MRGLERRKFERLRKDSETYKIMERAFDSSTLLTLLHMMNTGAFDIFGGVVSTGKEANIFNALNKDGRYVAIKIYRLATSDFKSMHRYLAADPRFEGISNDKRAVISSWASREFRNLKRAVEAGVPAPKPIDQERNVLVMEFLGKKGTPYPRMKDTCPKDPDKAFDSLINSVKLLYQKAKLVHSDLSEYNVLLAPKPVLIDFSLGTDIRNPMADELLARDIEKLVKYFRKLGVKTKEPMELFEEIREQ
jgi:RIO kinase 1